MITSVPLSAWLVLPSSVDSPVSFVVLGLRVVMSSNFLLFESIVAVTSKRGGIRLLRSVAGPRHTLNIYFFI